MNFTIKIIIICFFFNTISYSQNFKFSETNPTNNIDSLETWISIHKTPNISRLKSLIILERTYFWNNLFRLGSHTKEIRDLSSKLHSSTGIACLNYVNSLYYSAQNQTVESVKLASKALESFQSYKDNSGVAHSYCVLIMCNSTIYGNQIVTDSQFSKEYLVKIQNLISTNTLHHDKLMSLLAYTRYLYGQGGNAPKELLPVCTKALSLIGEKNSYKYAEYRFQRLKAIGHLLQGNFKASFEINQAILKKLPPNYSWESGTLNYNLSVDCYNLKKVQEGLSYCKKAIQIISTNPNFSFALAGPYTKYRELLMLDKNFILANSIADSVFKYNSLNLVSENDKKMLELQAKYDFKNKREQIESLTQKNRDKELMLLISLIGTTLLILLGYILFNKNKQLKKLTKTREHFFSIIAHDLRRPMHALQGMSELISFYLKRKDYESIKIISASIDESGVRIQEMLNNLLKWSLSQNDKLPYSPSHINIHEGIKTAVGVFESTFSIKQILIRVNCPEDLTTFVDPNAFELIIRNLLDNSFKHIHSGGEVAIVCKKLINQKIELVFSDNGTGVEPNKLTLLQKVLINPDKITVGEKGMGLGLILIGKYSKRNNVKITVSSKTGEGTIFKMLLPI